MAHLGVLAALDSLGVRPDLIVGTSMGAILGALYASGYTARQIDSLTRRLPISEVVSPFRIPAPHPWDRRIPLLFLVRGRHGFTLQTGVVDETQPNARLNVAMLRGNLLARGRFDRLPIPFRAVATDLRDRSPVVLVEGDLARAVRASSAVPLVFPPVLWDGAVLVDGGISANIPIAEARAAGAERVIVVDVTEHPDASLDAESPVELADQLIGFLFQQPLAPLGPRDLLIRPAVQGYRSLDFSPETMAEVLKRGRRAADTTLARMSCWAPSPRVEPSTSPLAPILAGWSIRGSDSGRAAADSAVLARLLGLKPGQPIDPAGMRTRLLSLADAETFRGAWLNPTGSRDTVAFRIQPISAPRLVGGLGVAYDQELGGQVWAGIFDRRMLGTTLEGSALASVGRFVREIYGAALWHTDAGWSRFTPMVALRARHEDVRQFDGDGEELPAFGTRDVRMTGAVELRGDEAWRFRIGGDAVAWGGDDLRGRTTLGGSVRVERQGRNGAEVLGETLLTGRFQSAHLSAAWPLNRRSWNLRPTARLGWGEDLPAQWTFPLGGDEGLPGLHLGELRGTREVYGSVRLGIALKGPVQARLLVAGGRAWTPGPNSNDWIAGGRLGLGADTPVGPIDVAYGVATTGRGTLYLRLGRWF
jgi:NTE family protein